MLVRATGLILPDFHLLTLGRSCHYLLGPTDNFYLFDPGLSGHAPMLMKRLNDRQFSIKDCRGILVTHTDPDRIGAIPYLREIHPSLPFITSPQIKLRLQDKDFLQKLYDENHRLSALFDYDKPMKKLSPGQYSTGFKVDRTIVDSDYIEIEEDLGVRVLSFPGHTRESLAYLVDPCKYLIADEGLGYYNGRNLAGPGFDYSLKSGAEQIGKFLDLDLNGLCMPNTGVLTAQLVRKHLSAIRQNISDLLTESGKAYESGMSQEKIVESIKTAFYQALAPDPLLRLNLERSAGAVWKQVQEEIGMVSQP